VSFDVAMRQLGGEPIMLTGAEMQLGRGETIADTGARAVALFDAIMIRILNHDALLELAAHAHRARDQRADPALAPCQVMADLMTFEEQSRADTRPHRGLDRRRQTTCWPRGRTRPSAFKFKLECRDPAAACAEQGDEGVDQGHAGPDRARLRPGSRGPRRRFASSTDTWVSMGDKDGEHRHNVLKPTR